MKTSTNNYDFSLSKALWLQLCGGFRSNRQYTLLKWYTHFFDFMFVFFFFRQKPSSWEWKREASVIAFVQYTEMSTGIWPVDVYSFLKCCSVNCRKVPSAGCATIFIQTGAVQSDNFCFDVFRYYCTRYCICRNVNRRSSAKDSLTGFVRG